VLKGNTRRDFGRIDQDIALMVQVEINTLRVYESIASVEVINKVNVAGLMVITNLGYHQEGKFDLSLGIYL
tara:strand:+ start:272 stop:484 length:213 start_codon:yes stop_codon:yes gene_type:complete